MRPDGQTITVTKAFQRSQRGKFGDTVIIIILFVIGVLLEKHIILPIHKQEIPSDSSLYSKPDTTETISNAAMILFSTVPWYTLFTFNLVLLYFFDTSFSFIKWLKQFYLMNRMLLFSFSISLITVDVIKCVIGAPRPYFLTALHEFEDGLIDESELDEARLSFVSGHSSHPMCSLFLLTLLLYSAYKYTQNVYYHQLVGISMISCDNPHDYYLSWFWYTLRKIPLLAVIIMAIPTMGAMFIGLSRIHDYKHFAVDVVSGMLIGMVCAMISYSLFWNETYFVIESIMKKKCDEIELTEHYASSGKESETEHV